MVDVEVLGEFTVGVVWHSRAIEELSEFADAVGWPGRLVKRVFGLGSSASKVLLASDYP